MNIATNYTPKGKKLDTGQDSVVSGENQSPSVQDSPNSTSGKRISVLMTDEAAELLQYLAEMQGISKSEALRKAIATEAYFLKERKNGSQILLQKPNEKIREVIFR
ncbi:MAG: CopG family transcriptional regulator [Nostocales cyanobacterium]|nr:MAG: CopG family transcriptional regulator [Nostocales cyanobacterium]TAF14061.1 MAG: CopG family transcriptional regulator [Nostocales cyanobacterium]